LNNHYASIAIYKYVHLSVLEFIYRRNVLALSRWFDIEDRYAGLNFGYKSNQVVQKTVNNNPCSLKGYFQALFGLEGKARHSCTYPLGCTLFGATAELACDSIGSFRTLTPLYRKRLLFTFPPMGNWDQITILTFGFYILFHPEVRQFLLWDLRD